MLCSLWCINHRMRGWIVVAMSLAAFGCAHAPAPAPKQDVASCKQPTVLVSLAATDKVNPALDGRGRPVQIRLYVLKSDAQLQTATFDEVWQNESKAFGEDLLKSQGLTVFPQETKTVSVAPVAGARNLAVIALFREPQGKNWFVSYQLDTPKPGQPCPAEQAVRVALDGMQVAGDRAPSP